MRKSVLTLRSVGSSRPPSRVAAENAEDAVGRAAEGADDARLVAAVRSLWRSAPPRARPAERRRAAFRPRRRCGGGRVAAPVDRPRRASRRRNRCARDLDDADLGQGAGGGKRRFGARSTAPERSMSRDIVRAGFAGGASARWSSWQRCIRHPCFCLRLGLRFGRVRRARRRARVAFLAFRRRPRVLSPRALFRAPPGPAQQHATAWSSVSSSGASRAAGSR